MKRYRGRLLALLGLATMAAIRCTSAGPPAQAIVFLIVPPEGPAAVVTVALAGSGEVARFLDDGSGLHLLAAGHSLVLSEGGAVSVVGLDGRGRRELFRARPAYTLQDVAPSPDSTLLAIVERLPDGSFPRLSIIDARTGAGRRIVDWSDPALGEFDRTFQEVHWHPQSDGVTLGSGGYITGQGFAQSLAFVPLAGPIRPVKVEAGALLSPAGRFLLRAEPDAPACIGFSSSHSLSILDLGSGKVVASIRDAARGLRAAGWSDDEREAWFVSLGDDACHPVEGDYEWWAMLADGSASYKLAEDPYTRRDREEFDRLGIEVQCGEFPRTPFVTGGSPYGEIKGVGGGCTPGGGIPTEDEPPRPRSPIAGRLFVKGRLVAEFTSFTIVGIVTLVR